MSATTKQALLATAHRQRDRAMRILAHPERHDRGEVEDASKALMVAERRILSLLKT